MKRISTLFTPLAIAAVLASFAPKETHAAPAFSVSGYVDETLYQGNGMISMRFDPAGRLWVIEKVGRVLVFEPNPGGASSYNYDYYEVATTVTDIPDLSTLTPAKSGVLNNFVLDPRLRNDNFIFRYTGTVQVPTAGSYTFYLTSDDDSRLYIDNVLIVNQPASGAANGTVTLTAGTHNIRVEYLEIAGGENLLVEWSGPGLARSPVAQGPFKTPSVFADYSSQVNTVGERGMTGLALDPNIATNRYVYILFASNTDQRILRLTANATYTAMVPGSELILLSGTPNANSVHKAGDMAFHPNDNSSLYVVLGDDGERTLVGNNANYYGKILKLNAANGQGLASNPFFDGNLNSVASRVWSRKYRNPFRFTFDPGAPVPDVLYISENGDGTDRIARIQKGADGGWDDAFTTNSADGLRKVLNTTAPSRTGIAIFRSGPLSIGGAPTLYCARYGGGDRNVVNRWTLTGATFDTLTPVPADNGNAFYSGFTEHGIVSFTAGPDGALYYTDSGQGPSTGTTWRLGRLRFAGGSAPIANFNYTPTTGQSPLAVNFTDTSTAPGSTIASRAWDFGDGTTSTATNPSKTFAQPGVYSVSLTVTNAQGVANTRNNTVTVYHQTSISLTGQVRDGRVLPAVNLAAATELRFYQKNGTTPLAVSGGTGANGNILAVPAGGAISATFSAQITGNGIVVSAGEAAADGVQHALIGLTLSTTAASQAATANFYLSDTMLRGKSLDTKGVPAQVDIGLSRVTAGAYYAIAGGRDFLGGSGIPASGQAHRVVADTLGYYHMPIRTGGGGATFHLDTAADTLAASHGKVKTTSTVAAGANVVKDLTIGLYNGGTGEADLSGIGVTPNVDFSSQIQSIFQTSCVACHNDIATNSGGLDLQSGASYAELVGQNSVEALGVMLVEPGNAGRSYLMEKINSAVPQVGTNMRPGDPMPLAQRALIRDWINQLTVSNPNDPPTITSGTTKVGTVGGALTYQITATNNPTSFNATNLPPGLSVNTTTGLISGTPTTAGNTTSVISATNANGTGNANLMFTITGGGSTPVITSAGTAGGTVGTAFTYQITASNSPTSFGATGLPSGLSVNTTTGAITGTPSATGTTNATISATNASGTGTAGLAITISAAGSNLALGKTAIASSTEFGVPNNVTDGGVVAPSRWGSVYAGDPAVADAQSIYVDLGTPTAFNKVTLRWETAYGSGYKIQTSNTANGTDWVDRATITGGDGGQDDITFASVTARYVRMLGVTRATVWGYSIWEFEVYNTGGSTVPSITSALTKTGTVGTAITTYNITATNTPTSYGATGLPPGLSVNTTTGAITGTPTAAGTTNTTISATNASGTGTATLVFTISAGGSAPVINSSLTASGVVNTAFSYTITATNSPTSFSATGLPAGLGINTSTGVISGTPTATGTTNITIGATNASGSDSETLVLTVGSAGSNLAQGKTAIASSTEFGVPNNVTDGSAVDPSRWASVYAGDPLVADVQSIYVDLGAAMTFNKVTLRWEAAYGAAYKIQTSNTANGTDWVDRASLTAQNGGQDDITFAAVTARYVRMLGVTRGTIWGYSLYEFEIYNVSGGSAPVINSATTASGTVGTAFSYTITATNSPTSYGATGLPSGLSINTTTGVISGTPSSPGTSNVTLSATNASGSDTETLVLTISAAGDTNLAQGQPATASSFQAGNLVANGNDASLTSRWAAVDGTFPQWWRVDLGTSKVLSRVDIMWLNPTTRAYKYRIETSPDDVNYTTAFDNTGNTTVGNTSNNITATARFVRITVTGSTTGGFASFYDIKVFGH